MNMKSCKTRGWYTFADGAYIWFNGLSAAERKMQIRLHGAIIDFEHTN